MKNYDYEDFRQSMAQVESCAMAVSDLMGCTVNDHLSWTVQGYLDAYMADGEPSREKAALRRMEEHYMSICAAVRAARDLSEAASDLQSNLYAEAVRLDAKSK